jgi:hypothetical protein
MKCKVHSSGSMPDVRKQKKRIKLEDMLVEITQPKEQNFKKKKKENSTSVRRKKEEEKEDEREEDKERKVLKE